MSKRIYFQSWGGNHESPAYAMRQRGESTHSTIMRAIASKNNCGVATGRSDGHSGSGEPHYQMTLAHPCKGGGWSPICQLWFSYDPEQPGCSATEEEIEDNIQAEIAEAEDRAERCDYCGKYKANKGYASS